MTIHQEVVEDVNTRSGIDRTDSILGRRVCVLSLLFIAGGMLLALAPAPARAQTLDLTTPYPEMSVQPGQTVTLDLEVRTTELGRVSLRATEVPEGWSAVIRGGGQAVSAVFADPETRRPWTWKWTCPRTPHPAATASWFRLRREGAV